MKNLLLLSLIVLLVAPASFAWGPGTHTYIAGKINPDAANADRRYGAVAPDLNQMVSYDQNSAYFKATHHHFKYVWDAAGGGTSVQKDLAWGFVTHNEAWGADYTAHISSLTLDPSQGYVIQKSQQLCAVLTQQLTQAGMTQYLGLITLDNCHFVLEYGIEAMLQQQHPELAQQLAEAAGTHSAESEALFMNAFAAKYGPAFGTAIAYGDGQWRSLIAKYAYVLGSSNPSKMDGLDGMAMYLVYIGQTAQLIDPSLDPALVAGLIKLALFDSIQICGNDYQGEIDATIQFVGHQLVAHKVGQ
jgi:hypothetical protein